MTTVELFQAINIKMSEYKSIYDFTEAGFQTEGPEELGLAMRASDALG